MSATQQMRVEPARRSEVSKTVGAFAAGALAYLAVFRTLGARPEERTLIDEALALPRSVARGLMRAVVFRGGREP